MRTRGVVLRQKSISAQPARRGAWPVPAVVALLMAVLCAVVVVNVLSDPSMSLKGILMAVVAVVGGLLALSVSALMFATGFQPNRVKR